MQQQQFQVKHTTMPPKRPIIKDTLGWKMALLEHRRHLLERVIAEFPTVLQTQRSKVEFWRNRLTVKEN